MRNCFSIIIVLFSLNVLSQTTSEGEFYTISIGMNASYSESTTTLYRIKKPSNFYSESNYEAYVIVNKKSQYSESQSIYYNIGVKKNNISTTPTQTSISEIPVVPSENLKSFALVIGNEDYKSHQTGLSYEQNVEFALNDSRLIKELFNKTLGIPEKNILYLENATYAKIKQALNQLELICKHLDYKPNIFFYYSGHGLPDEITKVPHIIPVDATGSNMSFAVSLPELFNSLTSCSAERVVVMLDACFTGGARNSGLVASRAVRVRPKHNSLNGRIVVFSSSSSDQSSKSYKEKRHGLFTYYFTEKIIETKGEATLGELDKYLIKNVPLTSILVNKTEQVPEVNISNDVLNVWKEWRFK